MWTKMTSPGRVPISASPARCDRSPCASPRSFRRAFEIGATSRWSDSGGAILRMHLVTIRCSSGGNRARASSDGARLQHVGTHPMSSDREGSAVTAREHPRAAQHRCARRSSLPGPAPATCTEVPTCLRPAASAQSRQPPQPSRTRRIFATRSRDFDEPVVPPSVLRLTRDAHAGIIVAAPPRRSAAESTPVQVVAPPIGRPRFPSRCSMTMAPASSISPSEWIVQMLGY